MPKNSVVNKRDLSEAHPKPKKTQKGRTPLRQVKTAQNSRNNTLRRRKHWRHLPTVYLLVVVVVVAAAAAAAGAAVVVVVEVAVVEVVAAAALVAGVVGGGVVVGGAGVGGTSSRSGSCSRSSTIPQQQGLQVGGWWPFAGFRR